MARRRLENGTPSSEPVQPQGLVPPEAFACPFCKSKMLSAECKQIDKITWACATCKAGLSHANATTIDPPPAKPSKHEPPNEKPFEVLDGNEKETITVTWGEELYTPRQFCSYRVGPFSASTTVRKGETRVHAGMRLMEELRAFADVERRAKRQAFTQSLRELFNETKAS